MRSAVESIALLVLGCGTQVPPPLRAALRLATEMLVGLGNLVFAEVAQLAQSAWNVQRLSELAPKPRARPGLSGGKHP